MKRLRKLHNNARGLSIAELLIATFLGTMVVAAGLEFYVTQHRAWLMQGEVSDVQHNARNCLDDIAGRMKMAGYGLTGHPAYEFTPGHLSVYTANATDVDTVQYYVVEHDGAEPILMRVMPGEYPQPYSDGIEDLTVTEIASGLIQVRLVARAGKQEAVLLGGDGYRRRELTTEVKARNLTM